MHLISLTSIPPRFAGLGPVLEALKDQDADRVVLCLPERYDRFPDWTGDLPHVPSGVELLRTPDFGPATKLLPVLAAYPEAQSLIICDDDWIYGAGWAAEFQGEADRFPAAVIAGSSYGVGRLGLPGPGTIVQGFAGVLLRPAVHGVTQDDLPPRFRPVHDIWLSAHLARQGAKVVTLETSPRIRPAGNEAEPLQDAMFGGETRADLNRAAAQHFARRFGIWS